MGTEEALIVVPVKIGNEEKKVCVMKPSQKVTVEAEMAASRVFAKLIKEKDEDGKPAYILRSQLNENLAEMGIYTEQDLKDITDIADKIKECEDALSKGGIKKKEAREICIKTRQYRNLFVSLISKQAEYDKNTVEHYSENAKMDYFIVHCLRFENGERIFDSLEDYRNDDVTRAALRPAIERLANLVSDYDPDAYKKLPENKFLKKYGYCDEEYHLINAEGQRIDINGNVIVDTAEDDKEAVETQDDDLGVFLDDEEEEQAENPDTELGTLIFDPITEETKIA